MRTPAIADRVSETTTTTGTGGLSLAGASTRYRAFLSAFASGSSVEYTIVHRSANEWETGVGQVIAGSPNTLTRVSIKASSNAGAVVNFSAGIKDVFVAPSAKRLADAAETYFAATL